MKNLLEFMLLPMFILLSISGYAQLTGEWKDNNGACYKIRQIDNRIYWSMDGSPRVVNVFVGYIAGGYITGTWVDVPGGNLQNSGTLSLRIDNNSQMTVIGQSRGYGGSVLTRGSCAQLNYIGTQEHVGCSNNQPYCVKKYNFPFEFHSFGSGKEITGTFGPGKNTFRGSFTGTVFKFSYNNASGTGTLNFSPDFKTFTGTFEDRNGHRGTWTGQRQ
jgi:hypothetical protein